MARGALVFVFLSCGLLAILAADPPALPETPKKPVTETYHNVPVVDDYRWLDKADDPAVKKWTEAQNAHSRALLDECPALEPLRKRLKELLTDPSPSYGALEVRGGLIFAIKRQPPKEQPFLITLSSVDRVDDAKIVLDPNTLDKKGKTAIDFYVPSHNGKLVAVALSEGGSEEGTLHIYETATGKALADILPRVEFPTGGGDVAWNADDSGVYYTRYPRGDERPKEDLNFFEQIYFHQLGTPVEKDTYILGKDFPRIAEIFLDATGDGRFLLATVQKGDGGEFEHYLMDPDGKWKQLTKFADQISAAAFGAGDDKSLYVLSRKDAPLGNILRLSLKEPDLTKAEVAVPEGKLAIDGFHLASNRMVTSFVPTPSGIYVVYADGGPSQMRYFSRAKPNAERNIHLAPVSSVGGTVRLRGDAVLINSQTFILPPAWFTVDASASVDPVRTALYKKSPADFSDCEVIREMATSKDGTKVPLNIIKRKETKLDGSNPTLLTGYGGFGISLSPGFGVQRRVWLDQGGVYAIANLRGGSEYGEAWHKGGNLTNKQNVFDDFAACAKYLIDHKYTNPDKLAIEGGSNGGLLMGAALTQHPDLFRAVVTHVGLYDMLRFEQHPNGAFNVTEYGSIKDYDQFKAIHAYSPYQHVKDGTAYPAVFLLTGANDGRVDPAHSRKMAARLQAATSSKRPVLLQIQFDSGHGIGDNLSDAINRSADVYAFLFEQLGMKYQEPR
ncbi:MAG TPA: prolyl oligopeptidase family serine peptidase [Gemmataceae bacterium]|jgi:prolyl oligopeptidase